MNEQYIQELLLTNSLRKTPFRVELLEVFIKSKFGLSLKNIKEKISASQDKVTIYRTLAIFEKKGIIHKVPNTNDVSKYALCPEVCSEKAHEHNHAHFICIKCENTFCMNEIELPELKKIKGYKVKKSSLTLEGNCPNCV
ncbi:MAG: Fur family ferric uptake transcriptional regulator [Salibacteraceae bacterium]|jgi:Fur family ferric uptake transcriptional regulator